MLFMSFSIFVLVLTTTGTEVQELTVGHFGRQQTLQELALATHTPQLKRGLKNSTRFSDVPAAAPTE